MKHVWQVAQSIFSLVIIITGAILSTAIPVSAAYEPLSVPNNKFGIHILDPNELDTAAQLVNSSGGQWGYVVIVIRSDDRDKGKWQQFFDKAREKKIIPIVRLATKTTENYWQKPEPDDANAWATFLSELRWPTNNHYITVYNEPNHATEWGNTIDPQGYANELSKTIDAIKNKDPNAFILNAGFDAAAPTLAGRYMDQEQFMDEMAKAQPDIFKKIDGWASHSYPQPEFSGSPLDTGRNTITTYRWETQLLKEKYQRDTIPVFITETGWAHQASGTQKRFYADSTVAEFYKTAYKDIWQDDNLVTIVPFTLQYTQEPFSQFSWVKPEQTKILGVAIDQPYFAQFAAVQQLPKISGQPIRTTSGKLIKKEITEATTSGQVVSGRLIIENTGETAWFSDSKTAKIRLTEDGKTTEVTRPEISQINPGEAISIPLTFLAPQKEGSYTVNLQLLENTNEIVSIPYTFVVTSDGKVSETHLDPPFIATIKKLFTFITNQQT